MEDKEISVGQMKEVFIQACGEEYRELVELNWRKGFEEGMKRQREAKKKLGTESE